jgi:putative heme-binding domain-containing protein
VANARAEDPFAAGVRTTPWLKPEEEQKQFKLPPGFQIELIAAEPAIQKPMNLAFDARGRIWVTDSVEYPFPAPLDKPGRDTIKILEDADGDGTFEKVTTFADGLNIPIGVYPYQNGCLAWSIPYIWHLEDTDRDGKCDRRTKLFGPFDHTRDVHGNINALRRGWDGWLYGLHGFNNNSHVKGADGHEVHLSSGNGYRLRLDGSRIEHFSQGQVNPFGLTFDPLFNLFSADCHSKPLTQLLRGGQYPSFGRPHDGLGFVPPMMDHSHGSTAIAGAAFYEGLNFPPEFRGNLFSGNVMTSRVNRDLLKYHGSTIVAQEGPDFLSTSDPWFRPVDLQVGPDGALYIADFYNRIIGHYEVPLLHPGRDRTSGRIWRVKYTGDHPDCRPAKMPPSLAEAPPGDLIKACDHETLTWRLMAQNLIAEFACSSCPHEVAAALAESKSAKQKTHLLWALERFGSLKEELLERCAADEAREVRIHAIKILSERSEWAELERKLALAGLKDGDAFVIRAAADALGRHPEAKQLKPLLEKLEATPPEDNHLAYVLRLAIREHLAALDIGSPQTLGDLTDAQRKQLGPIALAVKTPAAAAFLLSHLSKFEAPTGDLLPQLQHIARYAPASTLPAFVDFTRRKIGDDLELQATLLKLVAESLAQRGESPAVLQAWGESLARELLKSNETAALAWTPIALEGNPSSANPWVLQQRVSQDGDKEGFFFGSLPKGEQLTGILRSQAFELPGKLSFWCAGHSGFAGKPINDKNWIRLRDAATQAVLAESRPPRNDTAQRMEWNLEKHAGKRGYVELVDGDTANAYAWLAVGRFSLPGLNPSRTAQRQQLGAEIVVKLKLRALHSELAALLTDAQTDPAAAGSLGQALLSLAPDSRAAALVAALSDVSFDPALRPQVAAAVAQRDEKPLREALFAAMRAAPQRLQTTIAEALAGDAGGARALIELVQAGRASPRILLLPNVQAKLKATGEGAILEQVATLTASLPPTNELLDKLIAERRAMYLSAQPVADRGLAHFTKHCAVCHQIAGKGAVIGPQLDGIGNRGLERVLEDVLDPNRNVDVAFRTTAIRTTDGQSLTALVRREEGETLILATNEGKELSLSKADIERQAKTALSLMPANVAEILKPEELNDLVSYLLQQRGPKGE